MTIDRCIVHSSENASEFYRGVNQLARRGKLKKKQISKSAIKNEVRQQRNEYEEDLYYEEIHDDQADTDEDDEYGNTKLHYAIKDGDFELAKSLIYFYGNIDIQNFNGYSPLMIAVMEHNSDLVHELLENGANPNLANNNGFTSLHLAVFANSLEIMKLLVEFNGDIEAKFKFGYTPMYYMARMAAREGKFQLLRWLIENDADYLAKSDNGRSFYDECCGYGHHFNLAVYSIIGENMEVE